MRPIIIDNSIKLKNGMNLQEIKTAVNSGKKVYWINEAYEVRKDDNKEYFIFCVANGYSIGLTWKDGVTLNGKESDFFTNNY